MLAPGSAPLTVLQISDLHMTAGQRSKQEWVACLAALEPDLVINTGDNLAGHDAVPGHAAGAGAAARTCPGAFVMASNDYYAPRPKNPLKYFWPDHKRVHGDPSCPGATCATACSPAAGSTSPTRPASSTVGGRRIVFAGVDDSHLKRDRYDLVAGPADRSADVRIGLAHSPEPRVLDRFAADGYDLLLCGHTHGGQLRVPVLRGAGHQLRHRPGAGAVAAPLGRAAPDRPAGTWLHVSAGLGTSPYAPVRFACPPEATLLTLTARDA